MILIIYHTLISMVWFRNLKVFGYAMVFMWKVSGLQPPPDFWLLANETWEPTEGKLLILLTLSPPSWQLYQIPELLIREKYFISLTEYTLLPLRSFHVKFMSCADASWVLHKDYKSQTLCDFSLIDLCMYKLSAYGENPARTLLVLAEYCPYLEIQLEYFSIHADAID